MLTRRRRCEFEIVEHSCELSPVSSIYQVKGQIERACGFSADVPEGGVELFI